MPFPHREHEHLEHPPLSQVVFQLKFPPIFRINAEEPSAFQEMVRDRFPKAELLPSAQPPSQSAKAYRFQSTDEQHVITLTAESCGVSCRHYEGWQHFSRDLELMHSVLQRVYQPASVSRTGLRYINQFTRENVGREVDSTINMFSSDLRALVRASLHVGSSQVLVQLVVPDNGSKLAMRIAGWVDPLSMILDLDCFEEGDAPMDGVLDWGRKKHDLIYDAFRWCVSDEGLRRFRLPAGGKSS